MAGKRAAAKPATKAYSPVASGAHASSVPSAAPIGPAGYPPASVPGVNPNPPAVHMPTGAAVTNPNLPSAWPTTPPVLGGVPTSASPANPLFGNAEMHPGTLPNDDPPYPPDNQSNPTPMSNLPFQGPTAAPQAQLAPAGRVTLPSGNIPEATAMEPAGEVPFRPDNTTEQGR